jgi:ABC-type multidrug transport system fused ATPase/permease subunit
MPFSLDRYWRLLAAYLAPRRATLALLATLVFAGIGLQLLGPQLLGRFLDAAQPGAAQGTLLALALAYIGAALAQRATGFAALYVGENLGWQATNRLRADLTRHVIGLDLGFHKVHTPGELIQRLDGDITALANFFSQLSVRVIGNGLLILGVLAVLWRTDWRVGLGLSLYVAVALGALGALQRLGERRWEAAQERQAHAMGFLEERLQGTEDLRASGAEAHTLARYDGLMTGVSATFRSARLTANIASAATSLLTTISYAAGLGIAAALYLAGSASIGTAFMVVAYVGMLAAPLERLREQAQDLQQAGASIERVGALFAEQPRVREHPVATLPDGALALSFEGVTFAYKDDARASEPAAAEPPVSADREGEPQPAVLQDVTLSLNKGEVLGLLGRTGSGKTTVTRLLFRLYDPQGGAIRLGGADLRDLALADLRGRMAMVTQDVQIFQATVRENLTLFDESVDDTRLEAALRELGLWAWVTGLPAGLDTPLGGAHGLSAGEAQLLAFARIFLKDPGLVILDEASSRLDPATERLLEQVLDRLLAGRTAIIIAHRLSTVQRADRVAILDGGQLIEQGPREALAADASSRFARLLRAGIEEVLK